MATQLEQEQQAIRADMRERVQRGMAALDEQQPGWERVIDTAVLDLPNTQLCIIGQLQRWKSHMYVVRGQDGGRMYPPDLGMDLSDSDHDSAWSNHALYSWLTEEWVAAINARRGQGAST